MKKHLLTLVGSCCMLTAGAQLPYTVSTYTQPYTPITGGTNMNGTDVWTNSTTYQLVPSSFTYEIGGVQVNSMLLAGGTILISDITQPTSNVFAYMNASLQDRGNLTGSTVSPISFVVDGTAPNRILKVEIANAGFVKEQQVHGTQNDSVNMQIWLYETSNIFEIHYGPTQITDTTGYFPNGALEVTYIKNDHVTTGGTVFDGYYVLAGDVNNPYVDNIDQTTSHDPQPLNGYPENGRVYRFTPLPLTGTGIAAISKESGISLFPVPCKDVLNVTSETNLPYTITSVNGAKVVSGTLTKGNNPINVSSMPVGIYLLQAGTAGTGHRFIKE